MGIVLDENTYDFIIDTDFVTSSIVSIPDFIRQSPSLDDNIWSKNVLRLVYVMRVTHAEKWILDQLLASHKLVTLVDDIYSGNGDVWVESLEEVYEGDINWSKPWKVTIEMITESWEFCPVIDPPFISTHCPNTEITSSGTLVDDPSASLTFLLTEEKIVFVTYSACKYHGVESQSKGTMIGIKVDDNDVATIESSPYSTSFANGAFTFWIGKLGVGSHTIKGRFASPHGGSVIISERRLLIICKDTDKADYYYTRSTTEKIYDPKPPNPIEENCDPMPCAESPHPYPSEYDNTWVIQKVGAQCMRIHFTKIEIEDGFDHLYLKDGGDVVIKDYTGYGDPYTGINGLDIWSPWVDGNTIKLQLTSDTSVEYYGFYVDKIEYSTSGTQPEFDYDTEASFNFNLSETKKALILYSVCNYYDTTEDEYGKKISIEVDESNGKALGGSGYWENYPNSEFIAEIHELGVGNHTIKGMFAPNAEDKNVTISERQFGILLFPSSLPTNYVESSNQVSQTGATLIDDTEATAQKSLSESRCVFAIYCAGKNHETESDHRGKKVAIDIEGTDYTLNAQSNDADTAANTAAIQSDVVLLTAGSRTVKGRFASNADGYVAKIDERKLCVLWFDEATIYRKRKLTISKQCEGAVYPSEGTYIYWATENIRVQAEAAVGWMFDHWELDGVDVGSANPYTVQTDDKHELKAFFIATGVSSVQEFDTAGGTYPTGYPSQRRVFYRNGYYFLFHQDTNNDTVYKYSTDKENWTKPVTGNPAAIEADTYGDSRGCDIEYFGGDKVYIVVGRNTDFMTSGYTHLKVKEGTISNGEITWGSWVTIIYKSWSSQYYWSQFGAVSLCKSPDGYFWITTKVNWENSPNETWWCRSQNPNDFSSWIGPYSMSVSNPYWSQNVSLETSNGVYQMDKNNSGIVRGRTYPTGGPAGDWETVSIYNALYPAALSTPDGNIHIIYRTEATYPRTIRYRKRVSGVWGDEEVLATGNNLGGCTLSYINSILYAIYRDGEFIYYRKYESATWGDPIKVSCGESGYKEAISTTRTLGQLIGFMIMWAISEGKMIRVACN